MAGPNPSIQKRLREQKMQERREEKARRRAERQAAKKLRAEAVARGEDPDLVVGIPSAGDAEPGAAPAPAVSGDTQ
jgi:hypothetical protein